MKNRFEKKVVWITGGCSGLGKAMALEFAREGAMVAASGRRKDKLEATHFGRSKKKVVKD